MREIDRYTKRWDLIIVCGRHRPGTSSASGYGSLREYYGLPRIDRTKEEEFIRTEVVRQRRRNRATRRLLGA